MKTEETIFWKALILPFFFQRSYFISPFTVKGNTLVTSRYRTSLTYIGLSIYFIFAFTSLYMMSVHNSLKNRRTHSYLWNVIAILEVVFTYVTYPFMVIYAERKKYRQMLFYQRLYEMDSQLDNDFGYQINYYRYAWNSGIILVACLVYYDVIFVIAAYKLYVISSVRSIGVFLFLITYHTEQLSSGLMTYSFANCVMLVKQRFRVIERIAYGAGENQMEYSVKIGKLLRVYKDLCKNIDILNEITGPILLLRVGHDFTLATSQLYLVYWILQGTDLTIRFTLVRIVVIWMFQNFVRIALVATFTQLTVYEVTTIMLVPSADYIYFCLCCRLSHVLMD